jgi:hypothetical protein
MAAIISKPKAVLIQIFNEMTIWEFPKEAMVSYDDRDEDWCRYFGIGRERRFLSKTIIDSANCNLKFTFSSLRRELTIHVPHVDLVNAKVVNYG